MKSSPISPLRVPSPMAETRLPRHRPGRPGPAAGAAPAPAPQSAPRDTARSRFGEGEVLDCAARAIGLDFTERRRGPGLAGASRNLDNYETLRQLDVPLEHRAGRAPSAPPCRANDRRPAEPRARLLKVAPARPRAPAAWSACGRPTGGSAATVRCRSIGRWTRSGRSAGAWRTAPWRSTPSTGRTGATKRWWTRRFAGIPTSRSGAWRSATCRPISSRRRPMPRERPGRARGSRQGRRC